MPSNLRRRFTDSHKGTRLPNTHIRGTLEKLRNANRASAAFLLSALCMLTYPGFVPYYSCPHAVRRLTGQEESNKPNF